MTTFNRPAALRRSLPQIAALGCPMVVVGVHLHAHQEYWFGVLPIPTAYPGAPPRRWGPPIEDAWIVHGAPASAGQRGLLIPCIPGLVHTFLWHETDSTWGNPASSTPPVPIASS